MTTIEIADRDDVKEGGHVKLDVGNSRTVFVTTAGQTTSVVLADESQEKQASIMVRGEEWTVRER